MEIAPFDRSHTSPCSIVNDPILYHFWDNAKYLSKIAIFSHPLHSHSPLRGSPSEYCYDVWWGEKWEQWRPRKFDDVYSRLDTTRGVCHWQTDGSRHGIVRALRRAVKTDILGLYIGQFCVAIMHICKLKYTVSNIPIPYDAMQLSVCNKFTAQSKRLVYYVIVLETFSR